jgi:Raf kinase inhibitor-like YbhB/YbcL family protein
VCSVVAVLAVATTSRSTAAPSSSGPPDATPPGAFALASSAFRAGAAIPARYTCEGEDIAPPLTWSGVPAGARSLVLFVEDPDAPDPAAPKRSWVHWIVYELPPGARGLAEGAAEASLPPGAKQGRNDWGRLGYGGPCPPIGRHRYFFRLLALDVGLASLDAPDRAALERAITGHTIGTAELVGTYEKRR